MNLYVFYGKSDFVGTKRNDCIYDIVFYGVGQDAAVDGLSRSQKIYKQLIFASAVFGADEPDERIFIFRFKTESLFKLFHFFPYIFRLKFLFRPLFRYFQRLNSAQEYIRMDGFR